MQKILADITIPALSPEGFGQTQYNGRKLLVIGALPGECMDIRIVKKRKTALYGVPEVIKVAHPERQAPREAHYLSCSPWQGIPYQTQLNLKKEMVAAAYTEAGISLPLTEYVPATELNGYRTKAEFSFWHTDGHLQLAFHERGKPFVNIPAPAGCELMSDALNDVAVAITQKLDEAGVQRRGLKTLIVRESKTHNSRIAILYVTEEEFNCPFQLTDIPGLAGLVIAYSNPLSPVSRIDSILLQQGEMELTETIEGLELSYPMDGFFQNNIPLFHEALKRMRNHCTSAKRLVELYSGVGAIGLALSSLADDIVGAEIIPSAVEYAEKNARINKITNYTGVHIAAEKLESSVLANTDIVVVDPPRTGLHTDVIEVLLEQLPHTILYLSCNPSTQARDYSLLQKAYTAEALYGFDFYPNTLHQESLLILKKK